MTLGRAAGLDNLATVEITGLDLVRIQLELASGRALAALGLDPGQVPEPRGMAIEVRINLETMAPDGTVRPGGGTLTAFEPPSGPRVRLAGDRGATAAEHDRGADRHDAGGRARHGGGARKRASLPGQSRALRGVVANNPMHLGGAIDSDGADKAARFMQLCDGYDIPLLFLRDTPGNMVGPEAEKTALVRHCCRLYVIGASPVLYGGAA